VTYEKFRPLLIMRWNRMAEAVGPNWNGVVPLEREELDCLMDEYEWLRKVVLLNTMPVRPAVH
jgi:hypothetical protein